MDKKTRLLRKLADSLYKIRKEHGAKACNSTYAYLNEFILDKAVENKNFYDSKSSDIEFLESIITKLNLMNDKFTVQKQNSSQQNHKAISNTINSPETKTIAVPTSSNIFKRYIPIDIKERISIKIINIPVLNLLINKNNRIRLKRKLFE